MSSGFIGLIAVFFTIGLMFAAVFVWVFFCDKGEEAPVVSEHGEMSVGYNTAARIYSIFFLIVVFGFLFVLNFLIWIEGHTIVAGVLSAGYFLIIVKTIDHIFIQEVSFSVKKIFVSRHFLGGRIYSYDEVVNVKEYPYSSVTTIKFEDGRKLYIGDAMQGRNRFINRLGHFP